MQCVAAVFNALSNALRDRERERETVDTAPLSAHGAHRTSNITDPFTLLARARLRAVMLPPAWR